VDRQQYVVVQVQCGAHASDAITSLWPAVSSGGVMVAATLYRPGAITRRLGHAATRLCNERPAGTLAATVVIRPRRRKDPGLKQALQGAFQEARGRFLRPVGGTGPAGAPYRPCVRSKDGPTATAFRFRQAPRSAGRPPSRS
jgi:hypothetical protein